MLDLELCDNVWKRIASIELSPFDLASFDEAEYNSLNRLRHIDRDGVDEELFADLFFNTFEASLSDGTKVKSKSSKVWSRWATRSKVCGNGGQHV